MTPKEKAIELYNKYREEFSVLSANIKAKKCALIAVDEIIKSNTNVVGSILNFDYWQEVKEELQKL